MVAKPTTNCLLTKSGNVTYISGEFPLQCVINATSYYVDGFQFTKAYKSRRWDGKHHFFNKKTYTFPTGLVDSVHQALLNFDEKAVVKIADAQDAIPQPQGSDFELEGITFGKGKYDYQLGAALEMVSRARGIIKIATNGGKTEIACAVTKRLGLPTLFLVERLELLHQTRKRFSERLGIPIDEIGIVGDGEFLIQGITIATPKSLANKLDQVDLSFFQVVFCDECHRVGADTFYGLLTKITAPYRFGMSGTPLSRGDGADMKLIAQTGSVIYEVSNKLLVERGISVPPHVEMIPIHSPKLDKPDLSYGEVEKLGITENKELAREVVFKAKQFEADGKQTLILTEKVKHGKALAKQLDAVFISGKDDTEVRRETLERFKDGTIRTLVATTILDEGVDVPNIDALILAAGGKGTIKLLQRVGRGLRSGQGKKSLHVIDFVNYTHKWLLKHSIARLKLYQQEECFLITEA